MSKGFGYIFVQRQTSGQKSLEKMLNAISHKGLGAGGEGDDRGWDGWMVSLTRRAWVWVNSGSWWWTGRPGMLQFTGSQRVGHDWATELTDWLKSKSKPESDTTSHLRVAIIYFGHTTWHMGLQSPDEGWNPCCLHWECGVSITGLPEKFL